MRMFGFVGLLVLLPLVAVADNHQTTQRERWEDALAVRVEGYIGGAFLDVDPGGDDDTFQGGGGGTVSWSESGYYGQFDLFGDSQDFDGPIDGDMVGFGLHGGARDPDVGRVGGVLAYSGDDADAFRLGFEGELYLGQFGLDASLGYAEIEAYRGSDEDSFFFDVGADFYATDNLRIEFGGGLFAPEDTDTIGLLNVGAEFFIGDVPISLFTRWEAGFLDDGIEVEQHSLVFGMKVYWGGGESTLKGYDRNHFKRNCMGALLGTRAC